MNITRGLISRPQKVVIYGSEGIGKTTLASQFPDPVFIDTEGGTAHIDVARVDPSPATWQELLEDVEWVTGMTDICKTLVIDTADWAEQLAVTAVCERNKVKGIESFGYSKGYTYLAEEFQNLLSRLDKTIDAGMNVVITAHAAMRKFEQPDELGAYDRWEMKLSKRVSPLLKEWCDLLLFCNYETYVVHSDNKMEKAKAQGGSRVMYTTHHPCWDAKNRHGLPDKVPMEYASIAQIFAGGPPKPKKKPADELRELMEDDCVTDSELMEIVASRQPDYANVPINMYPDSFITKWCIKYWDQILNLIKEARNG